MYAVCASGYFRTCLTVVGRICGWSHRYSIRRRRVDGGRCRGLEDDALGGVTGSDTFGRP